MTGLLPPAPRSFCASLFLLIAGSWPIAYAGDSAPPAVEHLTLARAEHIALEHDPAIAEAYFRARAAQEYVTEVRSNFFPQIGGEVAAVAEGDKISRAFGGSGMNNGQDTRIGASGGLNNPSVRDRESQGIAITQLVTDFGRTSYLTTAARFDALAAEQRAILARAHVLDWTDEAYFHALEAAALVRVAKQTISTRALLAESTEALAANQLKSQLDVSFAQVALQQAKLLLINAENKLKSSYADLSAALGYREAHQFDLENENLSPPPNEPLGALILRALANRPEAAESRLAYNAALKRASADKAARLPTVKILGDAGRTPSGESSIRETYAAAGVLVDIPIFTGGRLSSQAAQSTFQAAAQQRALDVVEQGIARDVNFALLNAQDAKDRIAVTNQILASSNQAWDLAQARYKTGLASFLEVTQADLNRTQAEIDAATATYEYDIALARLAFQTGDLRFFNVHPHNPKITPEPKSLKKPHAN